MTLDRVAHLCRLAAANGFEDLAVPEEDDVGDGCDVVFFGDVGEFLGVDADEGGRWRGGDGVLGGEGGEDGSHLRAGGGPWGVEVEDDEG